MLEFLWIVCGILPFVIWIFSIKHKDTNMADLIILDEVYIKEKALRDKYPGLTNVKSLKFNYTLEFKDIRTGKPVTWYVRETYNGIAYELILKNQDNELFEVIMRDKFTKEELKTLLEMETHERGYDLEDFKNSQIERMKKQRGYMD